MVSPRRSYNFGAARHSTQRVPTVRMVMKYLRLSVVGLALTCGGCVVHQAVPVAAPVGETASAAPATQNCREFQDTVIVGGVKQPAYGTTCQQPDGSWRIASPPAASPPTTVAAAPVVPYPVYPAYPYYYPYPYYGYPAYYGPSVGVGFRFGGHWH